MMKITYEEFNAGKICCKKYKELDTAIIKILKDNPMEVKDITAAVLHKVKDIDSVMPYDTSISRRLRELRIQGKVVMKKIGNKYFWGLNDENRRQS